MITKATRPAFPVRVVMRYLARGTTRTRTHRYTFRAKALTDALERVGRLAWELNDHGHSVTGMTVDGLERFAF